MGMSSNFTFWKASVHVAIAHGDLEYASLVSERFGAVLVDELWRIATQIHLADDPANDAEFIRGGSIEFNLRSFFNLDFHITPAELVKICHVEKL
jgi:hypothetical protein